MIDGFLDRTGLAYLWNKITSLIGGKQDTLTFDTTPTTDSTNPVTSGGVKAYVDSHDGPVESGSGTGSVQTKAYTDSSTHIQTASGDAAFAEGSGTTASGACSHAEGCATTAYAERSHTEGYMTTASGSAAHAEGSRTTASGLYSHAEGDSTTASGMRAHAEGSRTTASGLYSHAEGSNAMAMGQSTHAEGSGYKSDNKIKVTSISGNTLTVRSTVNGAQAGMYLVSGDGNNRTMITAVSSFYLTITVEDASWVPLNTDIYFYGAIAKGNYSHVEGHSCVALGECSHAEGMNTIAEGENQHTEGRYNVASTSFAHITGIGSSQSSRKNGFTVDWQGNGWFYGSLTSSTLKSGNACTATGANSSAMGDNANASGTCAHAEGMGASASGECSHAEGYYTTASGYYSHAEGIGTVAQGIHQHVEGRYNIIDTNNQYMHIVGNGSSEDDRYNIYTLDGSGNAWFNGSITIHDNDGDVTITAAQLRQLLAGLS